MSEIKRISTPLPEGFIFEVACVALEELWTVDIQPDVLVDPSITISHSARALLRKIATNLTHYQRLLLCCSKWEFSANWGIDRSWAFYFGQGQQNFLYIAEQYSAHAGEQITSEIATLRFSHIKEVSRNQLREKYSSSMDIAQMLGQLRAPSQSNEDLQTSSHSDEDYFEYLYNQVYNFCFACLKGANPDRDNLLLRYWYDLKMGSVDVPRSLSEVERITADSKCPVLLTDFERAFRLATVAYCGLTIQGDDQNSQLLLGCVQRISKWEKTLSTENSIPPYLEDYARNLQRQLRRGEVKGGKKKRKSKEEKSELLRDLGIIN